MIKPFPSKDPDSNLRYYWDWRTWLSVEGCGSIVSFDVTIEDGDGALVPASVVQGDGVWLGVIQAWIGGGTALSSYTARCRITAQDGTVEDDSRLIAVDPH